MKKRIAIAALAVAGMASSALALSDADNQGDGLRAALAYGIGSDMGCFKHLCLTKTWTWPVPGWGAVSSIVAA